MLIKSAVSSKKQADQVVVSPVIVIVVVVDVFVVCYLCVVTLSLSLLLLTFAVTSFYIEPLCRLFTDK